METKSHQKNLSRRRFLIATAAMMATRTVAAQSGPVSSNRPNILFVAFDDLNDWIGPLAGYPGKVHTPNFDRLASRGMVFTNAQCSAPVCNASRASLLTGVQPATSGIYDNSARWREAPVLRDAVTLPHCFRNAGYRTSGGGKIFHALSWLNYGYGASENDPDAWDEYFPSKEQPMPFDRFPADTRKLGTDARWSFEWPRVAAGRGERPDVRVPYYMDWGPLPPSKDRYADEQVVDWASGELRKIQTRPLFLGVGIFKPHIPWFVPQEYYDLYPLDKVVTPPVRDWRKGLPPAAQAMGEERRRWHYWITANGLWKNAVQGYLAAISFADAQLGRLLDALDASPHARNTIIVMWGDNGFHLGERETWEKFTLWEESDRVPLMIVAPGVTKPGSRCTRAVSLLDIYPTLLELAKPGPPPQKLEGTSLVPLLKKPNSERAIPAITSFEPGNHSVRTERWRYTRYKNGDEELYDHEQDPNEYNNLANDEKYRSIKTDLAKWVPKQG
jgi:arylsulfatase A-like enzyme